MNPIALPQDDFPEDSPFIPNPYNHRNMKSLLSSSWQVLESAPPPTLREILSAYNAKGDGDREMLLAMLNAKNAEEQRLAALASLQKTMLDVYRTTALPPPVPRRYAPEDYSYPYHNAPTTSPPFYDHRSPWVVGEPVDHARHSPHVSLPPLREAPPPSSAPPPRKRSRTSHSPITTVRNGACPPTNHQDLPLSPYSSSHSDAPDRSPRARGSMAIDALLRNGVKELTRGEMEGGERNGGRVEVAHRDHLAGRSRSDSRSTSAGSVIA